VHKSAGDVSNSNVVLQRGLTDSMELWEWWDRVRDGNVDRRDLSIV
jgi:hypothetical protein